MNEQKNNTLESELIDIGYKSLFQLYYQNPENRIWKSGTNEDKLKNITSASNSSLLACFLSAETLRYYEIDLDEKYKYRIGKSYAYALEKTNMDAIDFIGISANSWGFLYNHNDAGYLGKRLISYGDVVIPDLIELLEIEGKVLYQGSQDATIGNTYQYRIKDFAAFYISKIKDIPITFYQDFKKRDAEIERLKELLEKE